MTLVFITNDLDLDAKTVASIYKARWEIELFFKTIKQNLKIKRFIGTSRNAVLTQIWIAMIAYLMVSFIKFSQKIKQSVQQIFRLLEVNLMERKCLIAMLKPKLSPVKIEQFCLFKLNRTLIIGGIKMSLRCQSPDWQRNCNQNSVLGILKNG